MATNYLAAASGGLTGKIGKTGEKTDAKSSPTESTTNNYYYQDSRLDSREKDSPNRGAGGKRDPYK